MRRYGCLFVLVLVAGFARSALALNHVDALRSGKVIVAVPSPAFFIPPSADENDSSRADTAILPVLFGSPSVPGEMKAYAEALHQLESPTVSPILQPYASELKALPTESLFLSLGRKSAASVAWIGNSNAAMLYRGDTPLDSEAMRHLTFTAHKDAVVFVRPIVVFSPGLRHVFVIARISVYGWGPVHAFFMGSTTLYSGTLLTDTIPELRNYGVEGVAASSRDGAVFSRARASVWLAHNAQRLNQAFAKDLKKLQMSLSAYLQGRS